MAKYILFDTDIGYINWMQKNIDLDVDMKFTLDKIMGHIVIHA